MANEDTIEWMRILKAAQTQVLGQAAMIQGHRLIHAEETGPDDALLLDQLRDCLVTAESHRAALGHVIELLEAKARAGG